MILVFLLFIINLLNAQPYEPKMPEEPYVPDIKEPKISIKFSSTNQMFGYQVKIVQSGIPLTNNGILYFSSEKISVDKEIEIKDISEIKFLKWEGKTANTKEEWIFEPSLIEIIFKDGNKNLLTKNIPKELKIFIFQNSKQKFKLYSFFYEYRKNKRWLYSDRTNFYYPSYNPIKGCLVNIKFY